MTWKRPLPLLFAMGFCAPACAFGEQAKVADGRLLARNVCAACHDIGGDKPWPPTLQPPAPSFASLARRHKLDEAHLRVFLAAPHGGGGRRMPDPRLLDYQIDGLVAYLRATRTTR